MKRQGLSQEALKGIACATMLLDHIGAAVVPCLWLRVVGRLAFPIYCFLLAEGVRRTTHQGRYALRLCVGAIFAEVPFDLLFYGTLTWEHQSVMVTLLLGLAMGLWMKKRNWKILPMILCAAAAELLSSDYGWAGIVMIWIFLVTEGMERKRLWQTLLLAAVCVSMDSWTISIGWLHLPVETFAVFAMVPICCYRGFKRTFQKGVQMAFYLFYPVHLLALLLIA